MNKALGTRMLGQFPLSVATSIAFESLFNMQPSADAPEWVRRPTGSIEPIKGIGELWINLRTLLRNIDGAIDKDALNNASPMDYYRVLVSEMSTIQAILNDLPVEQRPLLRFYTKSYQSLSRIWPQALFRDVTAPKLKIYAALENNVMSYFADDLKKGVYQPDLVIIADCNLHPGNRAALISHFPVDLVLTKGNRFVKLVESHTGAIKQREDWYTKLRDGNKYPRIPFDKAMVQIFGDKENMLSPQTMQIRKTLAAISEKYHWNPMTTKDRITFCVEQEHEPILSKLVKDCYRNAS